MVTWKLTDKIEITTKLPKTKVVESIIDPRKLTNSSTKTILTLTIKIKRSRNDWKNCC